MKKLLLIILVPLILVGFIPSFASASSPTGAACAGLTSASLTGCNKTATDSFTNTIKKIISLLSYIVGIASVIVIIVAGFRFMTSGGDSNAAGAARSQLLYAVIGLIVAAIAQLIARFALHVGSSAANGAIYFPHILRIFQ